MAGTVSEVHLAQHRLTRPSAADVVLESTVRGVVTIQSYVTLGTTVKGSDWPYLAYLAHRVSGFVEEDCQHFLNRGNFLKSVNFLKSGNFFLSAFFVRFPPLFLLFK